MEGRRRLQGQSFGFSAAVDTFGLVSIHDWSPEFDLAAAQQSIEHNMRDPNGTFTRTLSTPQMIFQKSSGFNVEYWDAMPCMESCGWLDTTPAVADCQDQPDKTSCIIQDASGWRDGACVSGYCDATFNYVCLKAVTLASESIACQNPSREPACLFEVGCRHVCDCPRLNTTTSDTEDADVLSTKAIVTLAAAPLAGLLWLWEITALLGKTERGKKWGFKDFRPGDLRRKLCPNNQIHPSDDTDDKINLIVEKIKALETVVNKLHEKSQCTQQFAHMLSILKDQYQNQKDQKDHTDAEIRDAVVDIVQLTLKCGDECAADIVPSPAGSHADQKEWSELRQSLDGLGEAADPRILVAKVMQNAMKGNSHKSKELIKDAFDSFVKKHTAASLEDLKESGWSGDIWKHKGKEIIACIEDSSNVRVRKLVDNTVLERPMKSMSLGLEATAVFMQKLNTCTNRVLGIDLEKAAVDMIRLIPPPLSWALERLFGAINNKAKATILRDEMGAYLKTIQNAEQEDTQGAGGAVEGTEGRPAEQTLAKDDEEFEKYFSRYCWPDACGGSPPKFCASLLGKGKDKFKAKCFLWLKEKLQPKLDEWTGKSNRVDWDEISMALDNVSTDALWKVKEVVKQALQAQSTSTEQIIQSFWNEVRTHAPALIVALLKPKLYPKFKQFGLQWEHVQPFLVHVSKALPKKCFEDFVVAPSETATFSDKDAFGDQNIITGIVFKMLKFEISEELVFKMSPILLALLRYYLMPKLKQQKPDLKLKWIDIEPVLRLTLENKENIKGFLSNPEALVSDPTEYLPRRVDELLTDENSAAAKAAIVQFTLAWLRSELEQKLEELYNKLEHGDKEFFCQWSDIKPALDSSLRTFLDEPGETFDKLKQHMTQALEHQDVSVGLAVTKFVKLLLKGENKAAIAQFTLAWLRPKLEDLVNKKLCDKYNLHCDCVCQWSDIEPALQRWLQLLLVAEHQTPESFFDTLVAQFRRDVLQDPGQLLKKLVQDEANSKATTRAAIAQFVLAWLRPQPRLRDWLRRQLTWKLQTGNSLEITKHFNWSEHVQPWLQSWFTSMLEDLKKEDIYQLFKDFLENPQKFLEEHVEVVEDVIHQAGPLVKPVVLAWLRPVVEKQLQRIDEGINQQSVDHKPKLLWSDVRSVLQQMNFADLKKVLNNPSKLIRDFESALGNPNTMVSNYDKATAKAMIKIMISRMRRKLDQESSNTRTINGKNLLKLLQEPPVCNFFNESFALELNELSNKLPDTCWELAEVESVLYHLLSRQLEVRFPNGETQTQGLPEERAAREEESQKAVQKHIKIAKLRNKNSGLSIAKILRHPSSADDTSSANPSERLQEGSLYLSHRIHGGESSAVEKDAISRRGKRKPKKKKSSNSHAGKESQHPSVQTRDGVLSSDQEFSAWDVPEPESSHDVWNNTVQDGTDSQRGETIDSDDGNRNEAAQTATQKPESKLKPELKSKPEDSVREEPESAALPESAEPPVHTVRTDTQISAEISSSGNESQPETEPEPTQKEWDDTLSRLANQINIQNDQDTKETAKLMLIADVMSKYVEPVVRDKVVRDKVVRDPQLRFELSELNWIDVEKAVRRVFDVYTPRQIPFAHELRMALSNPGVFVAELLSDPPGPATKWILLAQLRPKLQPTLSNVDMSWEDSVHMFEKVPVEVLRQALRSPDPQHFCHRILSKQAIQSDAPDQHDSSVEGNNPTSLDAGPQSKQAEKISKDLEALSKICTKSLLLRSWSMDTDKRLIDTIDDEWHDKRLCDMAEQGPEDIVSVEDKEDNLFTSQSNALQLLAQSQIEHANIDAIVSNDVKYLRVIEIIDEAIGLAWEQLRVTDLANRVDEDYCSGVKSLVTYHMQEPTVEERLWKLICELLNHKSVFLEKKKEEKEDNADQGIPTVLNTLLSVNDAKREDAERNKCIRLTTIKLRPLADDSKEAMERYLKPTYYREEVLPKKDLAQPTNLEMDADAEKQAKDQHDKIVDHFGADLEDGGELTGTMSAIHVRNSAPAPFKAHCTVMWGFPAGEAGNETKKQAWMVITRLDHKRGQQEVFSEDVTILNMTSVELLPDDAHQNDASSDEELNSKCRDEVFSFRASKFKEFRSRNPQLHQVQVNGWTAAPIAGSRYPLSPVTCTPLRNGQTEFAAADSSTTVESAATLESSTSAPHIVDQGSEPTLEQWKLIIDLCTLEKKRRQRSKRQPSPGGTPVPTPVSPVPTPVSSERIDSAELKQAKREAEKATRAAEQAEQAKRAAEQAKKEAEESLQAENKKKSELAELAEQAEQAKKAAEKAKREAEERLEVENKEKSELAEQAELAKKDAEQAAEKARELEKEILDLKTPRQSSPPVPPSPSVVHEWDDKLRSKVRHQRKVNAHLRKDVRSKSAWTEEAHSNEGRNWWREGTHEAIVKVARRLWRTPSKTSSGKFGVKQLSAKALRDKIINGTECQNDRRQNPGLKKITEEHVEDVLKHLEALPPEFEWGDHAPTVAQLKRPIWWRHATHEPIKRIAQRLNESQRDGINLDAEALHYKIHYSQECKRDRNNNPKLKLVKIADVEQVVKYLGELPDASPRPEKSAEPQPGHGTKHSDIRSATAPPNSTVKTLLEHY
eukprot:COSAG01_NODE_1434_length_10317_cov_4.131924_2_plen_2607_part_00